MEKEGDVLMLGKVRKPTMTTVEVGVNGWGLKGVRVFFSTLRIQFTFGRVTSSLYVLYNADCRQHHDMR